MAHQPPPPPGDCLDLGAARATDSWFLRRPAPGRPFAPSEATGDGSWQFCSTYRESAPTLRQAVLDLVRGARRKVFVTSFILGDDVLIDELAAAANRLSGGVYVISELSERSLRQGLARLATHEEGSGPLGQKVEAEKKRFISLTRRGVAVRGHENCHAKFVVVDDAVAWVGTANLETGAFTRVGEVGIVLTDPDEVDAVARRFARMWLSGCTFALPATAEGYHVDERTPAPVTVIVPGGRVGGRPGVFWTDADEGTLLTNVHQVVGAAERRLLLASYSLDGMTKRPELLFCPVADARRRGVDVTVFVRAMNARDRHRRDAEELASLGVRVIADEVNHAKAAVADGRHGALFSANFDANHGLEPGSGLEVGARLDGTPALAELTRYLEHAIANATHRLVIRPTAEQLNAELNAPWQELWPLPRDLPIHSTSSAWDALGAAAEEGPVLWARPDPRGPIDLHAGDQRFRLVTDGDTHRLDHSGTDQNATEIVSAWWARRRSEPGERGYCPARLVRLHDFGT